MKHKNKTNISTNTIVSLKINSFDENLYNCDEYIIFINY